MQFHYLRKKYPQFIYENYQWQLKQNNLLIDFNFAIKAVDGPEIRFKPQISIKKVNNKQINKIGESILNNLVFHLGLIEMLSYWKATCSPEIIIQSGYLDKKQINWWRHLIIKGMGQFFYENKIDWRIPNFLKIKTNPLYKNFTIVKNLSRKEKMVLVPVSGGKDSIVTLESIKKKKTKGQIKNFGCFSLNPSKIVKKIVKIAGCPNFIEIQRTIDPFLLKLNQKGFLNGHTPFSAYLAFLSVLVAVLFDYQSIAFSNEKSADEGNIKYLNQVINHQWSKTSEFEKRFQWYCSHYLIKGIRYFSFLRRYTELEIAQKFIQYSPYFTIFSSCNRVVAKKLKKRWCGQCPKCLFNYLIFYPFLEKKVLLKIFGQDILANKKLLTLMENLLGQKGFKPFECVGTIKEARLAFQLSLIKAQKEGKIPFLLKQIKI